MYNECRHIFTSGRKCQSPALSDQPFCYYHGNTRKRPVPAAQPYLDVRDCALALPALEELDAIQLALSDVVLSLAANRIEPRRARILIYGLQVASQNYRNRTLLAARETEPQQSVREAHPHSDGTLIGPEKQTPDPEEIQENRPLSLGQLLLREAEKLREQREAEEAKKAEAVKATEQQQPSEKPEEPAILPQIQAAAHAPAHCHHEERSRKTGVAPARNPCSPLRRRKCRPSGKQLC